MATPVLTVLGDRHVARVGASLLNRINLNEFVAESLDDYINKAVDLAQNPSALRAFGDHNYGNECSTPSYAMQNRLLTMLKMPINKCGISI